MLAKELRQFSAEELKGRVKSWQEELFRARFKGQTAEAKDTSVFKKLKRDIARANTVISEKTLGLQLPASALEAPKQTKKAKAPKETAAKAEDKEAPKKEKKASKGSKA